MVARTDVLAAIKGWLDAIHKNWELVGDDVSKKFQVNWSGSGNLAAQRCSKALADLRRPDKNWRKIMVGVHELYMPVDKSPMQQKLEMQVKRLRRAFCGETGMPIGRVYASQKDGFIAIDFTPVARVLASQYADTVIKWNQTVAEGHGVDIAAVQTQFFAMADSQKVEWTL